MTTPTSALAVANAFLDMQDAETERVPPIDPMKLQKLVFYAQAWWLAYKGAPLFEEDVCAWPWGPVVQNVYGEFREFGGSPIKGKRAMQLERTSAGAFGFQIKTPEPPNAEVQEFLRGVWESHKKFTGIQLSNATHAPGEPWTIVKDQYGGDLSRKPMIPIELMRDVYRAKLPA